MPYLAPELFRLEDPSPSSDAYACAVVLHEILVGKNEFRAQDVATTVSRVLEHVPTSLSELRADVPPALPAILKKALAKNKDDRFPDAAALAAALRECRPATEEEMQARVAAAIHRDFLDPRMSQALGLPSLQDREESWRNPPMAAEMPRPRLSSTPPTVVNRRPSQGDRGHARHSRVDTVAVARRGRGPHRRDRRRRRGLRQHDRRVDSAAADLPDGDARGADDRRRRVGDGGGPAGPSSVSPMRPTPAEERDRTGVVAAAVAAAVVVAVEAAAAAADTPRSRF